MLEETIKTIVKEAIRETLQEETKNVITYKEQNSNEEVMTTKQLAAYLQCSVPWLIKNLKILNIPYRKLLAKEYRFVRSEINNWLKEQNYHSKQKCIKTINNKKIEDLKII